MIFINGCVTVWVKVQCKFPEQFRNKTASRE